jgi:hypothetical protein
MRSILPLLSLSALLAPVQSLYFYIDGTTPKCFFEELPKDTLVVGHYTAEEWDDNRKAWLKHDGLNIFISVDVRSSSASFLPHPSTPFYTSQPSTTNIFLTSTVGSIRQRPSRNLTERLLLRPLHIHSRRLWRPQNLLRSLFILWFDRLALRPPPYGRH